MHNEDRKWELKGIEHGDYADARSYSPDLRWNYCVKDWLLRGEVSVVFGPSNCGKSALVCHFGQAIATGKQVFGARVTQGTVVHVGSEAPRSILERLVPYQLGEASAHLYTVRKNAVDLSQADAVEQFIDEMVTLRKEQQVPTVLIVFDTLARSIGEADENCNSTMTRVADAAAKVARAVDAHVMLVHHTGKDTDRGSRGASALRASVDTEISLAPSGSNGAVVVTQVKQRTMQKAPQVQFKTSAVVLGRDEDGDERTTVNAIETDERPVLRTGAARKDTAAQVETGVETFLYLRAGQLTAFSATEVTKSLPAHFFGGIAADSRVKKVTRALEALAQRSELSLRKGEHGWECGSFSDKNSGR